MALTKKQVKLRRVILVGAGLILVYFALDALFPEIVITSIHVGKRTYHLNWRL